MADYAASINPNDFLYRRNVHFTSPYSDFRTDVVAKLVLNANNFNFELANDDGSDFRLVAGVSTLRTWRAYWSKANKLAVLFFKLQNVSGDTTVSYRAYWGNESAVSNSEPDKLGVYFYESFDSTPLDPLKWGGSLSNPYNQYGYRISVAFNTITNPLLSKTSWTMEAGIYCDWDTDASWDSADRAIGISFFGTENDFTINIMHADRIEQNVTPPGGTPYTFLYQNHGGLEGRSFNDVFIAYSEPTDTVRIELLNRDAFSDISYTVSRKVEGDTRPNNVSILAHQTSGGADGANPNYINWMIIREYDATSTGELDGSELFIPYETVSPQNQDFRDLGPNLVSTIYEHESSFGGDPYLLSDGLSDADSNVWISDPDATLESSVNLTIHMGWSNDQLASRRYNHYDSSHVYYYNASKLSDYDEDRMGRNFWECTTSSGWAAIKFPDSRNIGALRVRFNTDHLSSAPKDFVFYGSNFYPSGSLSTAKRLVSGTFTQIDEWQDVVIPTHSNYKYYILDILNTYGFNANIKLQEWRMYDSLGRNERIYPTQLRLHPATYGSYVENFPKEIMFEGTLDGVSWTTLLPWTYTYTPYYEQYAGYGQWQRYSFENEQGFWSFRLNCRGNWNADDNRIIIGEWGIYELSSESYTYRILAGVENNIQQIWASNDCTLNDTHNLIYIANDKLNTIGNNRITNIKDLPEEYEDFNVV